RIISARSGSTRCSITRPSAAVGTEQGFAGSGTSDAAPIDHERNGGVGEPAIGRLVTDAGDPIGQMGGVLHARVLAVPDIRGVVRIGVSATTPAVAFPLVPVRIVG